MVRDKPPESTRICETVLLGDHSIGGQWSEVQHQNHIIILEMEAVYCAFCGFVNILHSHVDQLCIYFMFRILAAGVNI